MILAFYHVPHRDGRHHELAAGLVLSKHRLSDLLKQLVADGRLIKEGTGNQTRYRKNW